MRAGHVTCHMVCFEADAARDSKQSPMVQRNSSFATSHEVWKYICELGISKVTSRLTAANHLLHCHWLTSGVCPQVDLSMDDIETILNTLIYDGKVEMTVIAAKEGTVGSVDGQMKLYRGVNAVLPPTGLVKTPCGLCPVTAHPPHL